MGRLVDGGGTAACILHWGDPQLTQRCVESLASQTPAVTIAVVANDRRWAQGSADVEVLGDGTNRGYTGGMNAGLSWALDRGFEFVALVTNDGWFAEPDALAVLTNDLASEPSLAACGPALLRRDPDGDLRPWSVGPGPYPRGAPRASVRRPAGLPSELVGTAWLEGSCWVLRTAAVRDVGLLDDDLFMYFDEIDWCYRALLRGWSICRDDRVTFCEEASASASTVSGLKEYYMTRNGLVIAKRYRGPERWARNTAKAIRRSAGLARRRDRDWRWTAAGILDAARGRMGRHHALHDLGEQDQM